MPDATRHPLSANERLILDVVRRKGEMPRAAIAPETPLTQPWVHRLVDELLARGWLVSGSPRKGGRGKPSVSIALARQAAYAVGVDLETDSASMCLCDLSCQVIDRWHLSGVPARREATLTTMVSALQALLQRNGVARDRLVGIGFAISGFFVNGGQINAPLPLRDWSLLDLQPMLEAAFGLPVLLLNNATAAAIGESLVGVGRWARTFCYLSFAYGFGSGMVIDGKPYFGRHGNAGEVIVFRPGAESDERPALSYLVESLRANGIDVQHVEQMRQRFDPNWPGVDAWLQRAQPQLDRLVNTVAGLLDPDAIVFGGLLPQALGLEMVHRTRFWEVTRYDAPPPRPRLVLAEAGADAPALGAALHVLSSSFFS